MCAVAVAVILGCSKKDAEQPPPDFNSAAAPAQPVPAKFSLADFGALQFLEGTWRGTMPNGNAFFESYHFLNDSTIAMGGHTDSTFKTKSDSALIVFRNGAVIDSGGTVANAEKLDSTMVDFRTGPNYHFTWTKDGPDAWTARLFGKQADGTDRVTIYPMRRVQPAVK